MKLLDFFTNRPKAEDRPQADRRYQKLLNGMNLEIDSSIHELCEVYNKSSGSTRSVIYVLAILTMLSLLAVINTSKYNWTNARIAAKQKTIDTLERRLLTLKAQHENSRINLRIKYPFVQEKTLKNSASVKINQKLKTQYELDMAKENHDYDLQTSRVKDDLNVEVSTRNSIIKNQIENLNTVKVAVLGNSFDINNLAIISGVSFTFLLVVVRFTLTREKNNLRIALLSISERYNDFLVERDIRGQLDAIAKSEKVAPEILIALFNLRRRRYHYNFLSMNEVFNMPQLESSSNILQKSLLGYIVKNFLFSFPFVIYVIVFGNDLMTYESGFRISRPHTWLLYVESYIFINIIFYLGNECNYQKKLINKHFDYVIEHNYLFDKIDDGEKRAFQGPFKLLKEFFAILFSLTIYFLKTVLTGVKKTLNALTSKRPIVNNTGDNKQAETAQLPGKSK